MGCLHIGRSPAGTVILPGSSGRLILSLPRYHLITTNKSAKFESLSLFVFFFTLVRERTFIKMHSIEIRFVTEPKLYTVSRRVCARSSPDILQAVAVKGLIIPP